MNVRRRPLKCPIVSFRGGYLVLDDEDKRGERSLVFGLCSN